MAELVDAMLVVVELESGISVARQKKRTNKPLHVQVVFYSLSKANTIRKRSHKYWLSCRLRETSPFKVGLRK
jgi:hypothetical protein